MFLGRELQTKWSGNYSTESFDYIQSLQSNFDLHNACVGDFGVSQRYFLHCDVWLNCWASAKFRCFSIPLKGLGSITTQSSRFKNKNIALCFIDVENKQVIVLNIKKITIMQQQLSVNMTIVLIRKLLYAYNGVC